MALNYTEAATVLVPTLAVYADGKFERMCSLSMFPTSSFILETGQS